MMNAPKTARPFGTGRESWPSTLELAVREVFELMLGCSLEASAEPLSEEGLDITAMVGLAGQLSGMLTMRCRVSSAAGMAARMLGTELDAEEDGARSTLCDAAGEICNMVAGNFKNKISGLGDGCVLSVPRVSAGSKARHRAKLDEEIRAVMLFMGDPIVFTLEIEIPS